MQTETTVVVTGHLLVEPSRREDYLLRSVEVVRAARAAEGCLDFTMGADLLEPGRVNVLEHWTSVEAVERFRGSGPEGEQATDVLGGSVQELEVVTGRRLV